MENKLFYCGLTASFAIHLLTILYFSVATAGVKIFPKPLKPVEVTYQIVKKEPAPRKDTSSRDVRVIKQKLPAQDIKVFSKTSEGASSIANDVRDISKLTQRLDLDKKKIPTIQTLDLDRRVVIPFLESEKITNPRYLDYNEDIRQRIKQTAYSYVDHPDFASGEVYLTFVLASSGVLRNVKVIASRTSANRYLQEIGVRSIENSAPFPSFPHELDYPELTFNVIISFEVGQESSKN